MTKTRAALLARLSVLPLHELQALDTDVLDRAAFGVATGDLIEVAMGDVAIQYDGDLSTARDDIRHAPEKWRGAIDLPIEFEVVECYPGEIWERKRGSCLAIEDGHHRYLMRLKLGRATIRGRVVAIRDNPVTAIHEGRVMDLAGLKVTRSAGGATGSTWESARGDGHGILLARVGGLSPGRQTHDAAPVRHGVWAFIWPHIDPFLLGSTGPEGLRRPGAERSVRMTQLKREGLRKFKHQGELWTLLPIPTSVIRGRWRRTTGVQLAAYLRKYHAIETGQALEEVHTKGSPIGSDRFPHGADPKNVFGHGQFEVFVPNPEGT